MHYNLVMQIFSHLSQILDLKITFTVNFRDDMVGYINSNYAKLIDTPKAICGYIFMLSSRFLSY